MKFIKKYKSVMGFVFVMIMFFIGIRFVAVQIATEFENQGGVRQVIVDAGRGIKSIIDDIKR